MPFSLSLPLKLVRYPPKIATIQSDSINPKVETIYESLIVPNIHLHRKYMEA
jgi:hypothetical protein